MQSCHRSAVHPRPIRRSRSAFTLLELLIVLAIIGVIAAMVVPRFLAQQKGALVKLARIAIKSVEQASDNYAVDHDGEPPSGSQDVAVPLFLKPLDKEGKPMKQYIDKLPKDPWDQPLFYEYPNSKAPDTDRPAIWSSSSPAKLSSNPPVVSSMVPVTLVVATSRTMMRPSFALP